MLNAFESGVVSAQVDFVGNFLRNMALTAGLNHLWALIETQRFLTLLPLCRVTLPADATVFFKHIFEIAAFAFYDTNDLIYNGLDTEPGEPFNDNMEDLGFDTQYMLNNMGSMVVFYLLYPPLALISHISLKLKDRFDFCLMTRRYLRERIYYGVIIVVIFETYVVVALCCVISLPALEFSSSGLAVYYTN